jgi:glycosyltransferase involved in cell wall biosynthesis
LTSSGLVARIKVSVVVPVLNQQSTIGDLLRSLAKLDYARDDTEIIIVDNGSCDNTQQMVRQYPFTLIVEPEKRSSYAARNLGISKSSGGIIAFTDGDCIVSPSWLNDLVDGFADVEVGGVAGTILHLEPRTIVERFQVIVSEPNHKSKHQPLPYAVTANVAYRREVFEKIGRFDETLPSGSDVDFALRMQKSRRYAMRFLDNAGIVFHRNKRGLGELLRAVETKGYGYYHLARKHPDVFPGGSSAHAGAEMLSPHRIVRELTILVRDGLFFVLRRSDGFSLLVEPVHVLWQLAWVSGIRRAERESESL